MSPEQFQEKLRGSIPDFARVFNNAPFVAILDVEGALKSRIFNKGLDTAETKIGDYDDTKKQTFLTGLSKPSLTKKQTTKLSKTGENLTYKELRELKGLQTSYVDLEFTGALRNSIITGQEDNKATIIFSNTDKNKIAGYLTVKYKKDIFKPSIDEQQQAKEIMLDYIREQTKGIIKEWR